MSEIDSRRFLPIMVAENVNCTEPVNLNLQDDPERMSFLLAEDGDGNQTVQVWCRRAKEGKGRCG
jgi:hypothetical protein